MFNFNQEIQEPIKMGGFVSITKEEFDMIFYESNEAFNEEVNNLKENGIDENAISIFNSYQLNIQLIMKKMIDNNKYAKNELNKEFSNAASEMKYKLKLFNVTLGEKNMEVIEDLIDERFDYVNALKVAIHNSKCVKDDQIISITKSEEKYLRTKTLEYIKNLLSTVDAAILEKYKKDIEDFDKDVDMKLAILSNIGMIRSDLNKWIGTYIDKIREILLVEEFDSALIKLDLIISQNEDYLETLMQFE